MYCANFTPLIPLRSYSANSDSRRSRDTSTRPCASWLNICPGSSAPNVMDFSYDISTRPKSGARRDAYLSGSVQLTASTKTDRDLREDLDGRKSGGQESAGTTHR